MGACVDEKIAMIQKLERTMPGLPVKKGGAPPSHDDNAPWHTTHFAALKRGVGSGHR